MPPTASPARQRIQALDVLRGLALCGILVANVRPIANAGGPPVAATAGGSPWPGLLVDQRFFPVFSLLFGVGFILLLEAARRRTERPRLILLRRLLILAAIGLAHHFLLWDGDILTVYAVVGLLVLLPSTWLPRWVTAGLFTAGAYVCAVLLLLRTPLRRALTVVFAPLGRTALSNYITASAVVLLLSQFIDGRPETWPAATVLSIAAAVLAAQWTFATLWLRRFANGPLEGLWRRATWGRAAP
ncbi:DUF418 domain-containing protein [Phytomonospora sp. NPDC050363]|uniref:DUF418 domain-containing protein n=1 Tax=Phytomonospora sp. NPDC050363 TaxID=3155642 RepID=UPI0033C38CA5